MGPMPVPLVHHADYVTDLPPGYRFPMAKFGLLAELLVADGLTTWDRYHRPAIAPLETIELVHDPAYVEAFCTGELDPQAIRRIGLAWSPALVKRTRTAVGGTILTARLALDHGLACNTAGGTHHAHRSFGSGYCIFNDLAIAARLMLEEGRARRILIVDLDVHQGDGTAAIFADDPAVFTFSMHCGENFPLRKCPSDLDVPLPAGLGDAAFLAQLRRHLPPLLDRCRPDLVLYDAGVDPHAHDRLGKLQLTNTGLRRRDELVIDQCRRRDIPLAAVIGGGYDSHGMAELVTRHALLHQTALALTHRTNGQQNSPLAPTRSAPS